MSLDGDAASHLRVTPTITQAYVAPGRAKGFTVLLHAENNFPQAVTGEVVIESLDCGVHTVIPVTIGEGDNEPVCGDAMMTVRSQGGNWKQLNNLYFEDSFQQPFAGVSNDKIEAVHRATMSLRFINKRPTESVLPTFTADVLLNELEVGSVEVDTANPDVTFDIYNRKNILMNNQGPGGGSVNLDMLLSFDDTTQETFYNDYVVPTDLRLETTFSFEQCLMLPDDVATVNEYLTAEGLVPEATTANDGFCNSARDETALTSPLDCGCTKRWVSGLTKYRERGGFEVACGSTHVGLAPPRDVKWLDDGEDRTTGTGRLTELASLADGFDARNVIEDEILHLDALQGGAGPSDIETNVEFTNVTLNDADRRGLRETMTGEFYSQDVTKRDLRIQRRLFPAYDADGTGILVSDIEITNLDETKSYEGRLVAGLLLKELYRTESGDDYAVDEEDRYATVVAAGDYAGDTRYRLLVGAVGSSPGNDCWSGASEQVAAMLADNGGVAAAFDVQLQPQATRHYVVYYVPPFDENDEPGTVHSQWYTGHTFTCEAIWDASYDHNWCDLDISCEGDRETDDACPAECGSDPFAAPAGFLTGNEDGVCGEGESAGTRNDDGDANDCGCGPGDFYGSETVMQGAIETIEGHCYPGQEWSVFKASLDNDQRQPGENWAQPSYVEGQDSAADWTNGMVDTAYLVPYDDGGECDDAVSLRSDRSMESCFRIFRKWFWLDEDDDSALITISASNIQGLFINGVNVSATEDIIGKTDVTTFDLSCYIVGAQGDECEGKPGVIHKGEYNLVAARVKHGSDIKFLGEECTNDCVGFETGTGGLRWIYNPKSQKEYSSGMRYLKFDSNGDGDLTNEQNLIHTGEYIFYIKDIFDFYTTLPCDGELEDAEFLGKVDSGPVKTTFKFKHNLREWFDCEKTPIPVNIYYSFRRDMPNCIESWMEIVNDPDLNHQTSMSNHQFVLRNPEKGMSKDGDDVYYPDGIVGPEKVGYTGVGGETAVSTYLINLNKLRKDKGGVGSLLTYFNEDQFLADIDYFTALMPGLNWEFLPGKESEHYMICFFNKDDESVAGKVSDVIDDLKWNTLTVKDKNGQPLPDCQTLSGNEIECSTQPPDNTIKLLVDPERSVLVHMKGLPNADRAVQIMQDGIGRDDALPQLTRNTYVSPETKDVAFTVPVSATESVFSISEDKSFTALWGQRSAANTPITELQLLSGGIKHKFYSCDDTESSADASLEEGQIEDVVIGSDTVSECVSDPATNKLVFKFENLDSNRDYRLIFLLDIQIPPFVDSDIYSINIDGNSVWNGNPESETLGAIEIDNNNNSPPNDEITVTLTIVDRLLNPKEVIVRRVVLIESHSEIQALISDTDGRTLTAFNRWNENGPYWIEFATNKAKYTFWRGAPEVAEIVPSYWTSDFKDESIHWKGLSTDLTRLRRKSDGDVVDATNNWGDDTWFTLEDASDGKILELHHAPTELEEHFFIDRNIDTNDLGICDGLSFPDCVLIDGVNEHFGCAYHLITGCYDTTPSFYGYQKDVVETTNVKPLHENDLWGKGVTIAVKDTGFYELHEALTSSEILVRADCKNVPCIQVPYLFDVYGDTGEHGTGVLSTIAGYRPFIFVGTAPRASFILEKYGSDGFETPALEYAINHGAQIFSNSWEYQPQGNKKCLLINNILKKNWDLHIDNADDTNLGFGETSRRFDETVDKSVIISQATGNQHDAIKYVNHYAYKEIKSGDPEWDSSWNPTNPCNCDTGECMNRDTVYKVIPNQLFESDTEFYSILPNSDAFNVISVGAANTLGSSVTVASFSGRGPTGDGRLKPDVIAPGVKVRLPSRKATSLSRSNYNIKRGPADDDRLSGTSFSTPFVAGVSALLLQSHPDWTPNTLKSTVRSTASKKTSFDNEFGYGLVNAQDANGALDKRFNGWDYFHLQTLGGNAWDMLIMEGLNIIDIREPEYAGKRIKKGVHDVKKINVPIVFIDNVRVPLWEWNLFSGPRRSCTSFDIANDRCSDDENTVTISTRYFDKGVDITVKYVFTYDTGTGVGSVIPKVEFKDRNENTHGHFKIECSVDTYKDSDIIYDEDKFDEADPLLWVTEKELECAKPKKILKT